MSKQSNPTLIGAFVVGAVALLALAVVVFGGSELLARKAVLVTYFDGSVKGLRTGSNVVFRGVRVGFVRGISLLTDIETLAPKIEVTMELLPDSIKIIRQGKRIEGGMGSIISVEQLVDAGLSAQLGSESFVTGQLLVELDFRPEQELTLYNPNPPYPEIPSVPSEIQQAFQRFQTVVADIEQNVDFAMLSERVFGVLQGLDELANSTDLRESLAGFNRLINAEDTQRLSALLQQTVDELRVTIREAGTLVKSMDGEVSALAGELRPAAARLNTALTELETTLRAARQQITGESAQMYQLRQTLTEVEAAAASIRAFFDYAERHPEALLRGKRQ